MADSTTGTILANSPLLYSNGIFEALGYGTPYLSPGRLTTCNRDVKALTDTMGKLLFGIMQMPDVWVSAAPELLFIKTVGKAIDRFRTIMAARMIADGQVDARPQSISPAQEPFLIFPIPYFYVRNSYAKDWAWGIMMALAEAMKSHDNALPSGIHSQLASTMSMYTEAIYRQIGVELLGKAAPVAPTVGAPVPAMPTLSDADYGNYAKSAVFSSIERVDQGAPLSSQLPSEALAALVNGIPATQIYSQLKNPPGSVVNSLASSAGAQIVSSQVGSEPTTQTVTAAAAVTTPTVPAAPAP